MIVHGPLTCIYSIQQTTIAMCMLSLGKLTKAQEEYCHIASNIAWESMLR